MRSLQEQVLLLMLAEREDLSEPVYRRWLALCQEKAAEAALAEILTSTAR